VTLPLEGIRVLDLTWIVAGPLASRLLADFGAEVIKIESSTKVDGARWNGVHLFGTLPGNANRDPNAGGYFQDVGGSKLSCSLNLATSDGLQLLRKLVVVSDVIICNLGGDQLQRWGIGYEQARLLNPTIIVVNMPSMESSGPRANWSAYGDEFAAVSGIKSVSGNPGELPLLFGHHYPDFGPNPFHGAIAVMAALHHRDHTGEGQFVEVSQYESTISVLGPAVLQRTAGGELPGRVGNHSDRACPHNIYRCKGDDAWCAITVLTDDQWQSLVSVPALAELRRPEFGSFVGRKAAEDDIDTVIERWTADWDRQDLASFLQSKGVPAGPLQFIDEVVGRDPVLDGDYFNPILDHPSGREFLQHPHPARMSRNPAEARRAPLLGEHTSDILSRILGLSEEEIAEYAARGALE
jgi:benzylsuccinate CoA-transferase BbsF subunit